MVLLDRFRQVRAATLALAAPLGPEDCAAQSMPEASPVKWHLAHTTWFFETFVLEPAEPGFRPCEPLYRVLFNSYYNGVGEQHPRPRRGLLTRPTLDQVRRYRGEVEARVERLLTAPAPAAAVADTVTLGLHHEQQHQELLLTDLKHLFWCNPLRPAYHQRPAEAAGKTTSLDWHPFPGGLVEIGDDGSGFAFDNERPRHRVYLPPFALASRLTTGAEYLAFIADGGYRRQELWLSEGWEAVRAGGWEAPLYWERRHGDWLEFTLAGLQPVTASAPVAHVSYFEADAFARWSGARLPLEAEHEVAAAAVPVAGNLAESGRLEPAPAPADTGGPVQLFGDLWEWTGSAYLPYPGYRPEPGAIGEYNGKFMSGQMVLRGGSCVTPASHLRSTYRNFFPPATRWQWSGIRLARDAA